MNDPFENKDEITHRDKMLYIVAYIPFANIGLFFLDIERTQKLQKFMNQGVMLLICYVVFFILLGFIWGKLISILTLMYLCLSIYLAHKAIQGEYVEITYLTTLIDRFLNKK